MANTLKLKDSYLFGLIENRLLLDLPEKEKENKLKLMQRAYWFSKAKFEWIFRDNWEPYFRHLERTAEIILKEFPNPTVDKVVLALLHDIFEDTATYPETIKMMFGNEILEKLFILSKDVKQETQLYQNFSNKTDRNKKYFERLLNCSDKDVIDVKLADRIDNLRTMEAWSNDKIKKKIQETKDYILPLADKYNLVAKRLLLQEIAKLEMKLNLDN